MPRKRTRIPEEQQQNMDNDLKYLNRIELLQALLQVTESNEALMAENAELKKASAMQVSRSAKVGSIAEAALQANGFFEAAQRSADDYLREIKKLRDEMVERSRVQQAQASQRAAEQCGADELEQSQRFESIQERAKTYIQDVQTYANNVMARADSQARGIVADAQLQSDRIISQANEQAQAIVEDAKRKADLEAQEVRAAMLKAEEAARKAASRAMSPLDTDPVHPEPPAKEASKSGLDPDSTGALIRRGRHVRLPKGAAI